MAKSLYGKSLQYIELYICENSKKFLKRHDNSIEVLFLLIYVALQLFLVYIVRETIVAVFIILFLSTISLERIILRFQNRLIKEEHKNRIEKAKEVMDNSLLRLARLYDKSLEEIRILKIKNKISKKN